MCIRVLIVSHAQNVVLDPGNFVVKDESAVRLPTQRCGPCLPSHMNIALWIAAALLAIVFLLAGAMKIGAPRAKLLANPRMGWVNDVSDRGVKIIGVVEVLGAIGLILPPLTGVAPFLVGWAAVGLAIVMAGAIAIHVRREETKDIVVPVVLLLLAAFVAWGRFGDYAFV